MKTKIKWAKRLGIAGASLTAVFFIAFPLWPPVLLRALRYLNFLTFDFCDRFVASFFQRPIAPPPQQSALFALCLIVTAGIQWFIVGLLVDWLAGKRRGVGSVAAS